MTFNEFKTKALFENVMGGNGLDSYSNYSGTDFAGWLCGPTKTRDSEILDESNFDAALERLGGESDDVQVQSCGHWACGHFDRILVKVDSPKAKELFKIHQDLENYPILDESDHSEREYEYMSNYANDEKESVAKCLCILFGLPENIAESKELQDVAYEMNMQEQMYSGTDSAVFNNQYHVDSMNERDLACYERCLTRDEGLDNNPMYHLIMACFGLES